MNKQTILKTAYDILDNITPLKLDCGSLCGQACCREDNGSEEETGMFLFPGEEELFSDADDWMAIIPVDSIRPGLKLARCNGTCPRDRRPLACRIFPLTPYLTKDEILLVKMDPRAAVLCPLAREMKRNSLRQDFINAVRKASTVLVSDPDIKEYIYFLSEMLDDYTSMPWYKLIK